MNARPGGATADPDRNRVAPNAALAVVQVVVTAATLFFLYRFLLSELGIEALGVWSLVIAATSLASVSNMGLAGGTVRFVSKYLAGNDVSKAGAAAETAVLSVAAVMAVAALALWPIGSWVVGLVVSSGWAQTARDLLPFTLAALWLQSVGGAIHSGLDGCHRAGIRSIISAGTQPLILLFGVVLVPRLGLKGIAVAQLLQYGVWLILGWVLLRKYLPSLPRLPRRWSRSIWREMWRYGLNFQAISVLTILADPLAKALLSHFGGLSALGYFEMANRLVLQVRSLLVSANQVLVPYYSKVSETSREAVRSIYQTNLGAVALLGGLAASTVVAFLPLISSVWIGHVERQFLLFAVLLAVGWLANILSVPAYFANLGGGWIWRNVLGHLTQTVCMIVLGVVGGKLWGATGSVTAYVCSLAVGSAVILGMFHRAEGIPISVILSAPRVKALGLGFAMAGAGFLSYLLLVGPLGSVVVMLVSIGVVAVGWALILLLVPEVASLVMLLSSRAWPTRAAAAQ